MEQSQGRYSPPSFTDFTLNKTYFHLLQVIPTKCSGIMPILRPLTIGQMDAWLWLILALSMVASWMDVQKMSVEVETLVKSHSNHLEFSKYVYS